MSVRVKICGIEDLESGLAAVEAGADYLGFNFVKSSRRYIEPKRALEIIRAVGGRVMSVGVFKNERVERVNEVVEMLGLDFVQLHGDEDSGYIEKVRCKAIKRVSVQDSCFDVLLELDSRLRGNDKGDGGNDKSRNNNLVYLLLDREEQGGGEMVEMDAARKIAENNQIFFAGGLRPENVRRVIERVRPFAVDVAGGVETEGKKDVEKIRSFIKNVRRCK